MEKEQLSWLKSKGYIHITPQINIQARKNEIIKKVKDEKYVARYAFFPLIHSIIKERKYKKTDNKGKPRAHSYINAEGKHIRTAKNRPLHYATHMDAIIFGYYAHLLQNLYEDEIKKYKGLSDSIIAYRKIPITIGEEKNKSTIHFANEVFEEIRSKTKKDHECVVFAFDIKSFFPSLDHQLLKKAWAELLDVEKLPPHHYNVFKASTRFSYILKDDLRKYKSGKRKRVGFDEKELARIRNKFGVNAFFESSQAFRNKIKLGELKIHKYPFRSKETGKPIGIPQGLPISAVLANLYLLDFDLKVLNELVSSVGCFYRRYSDDIVIVCKPNQAHFVKEFITKSMEESKVPISTDKTEQFLYKTSNNSNGLDCLKLSKEEQWLPSSFIYLGFEFDGKKTLIKSANLAKFYRRMIYAVKRKAKRAIKIANQTPNSTPVIYRNQLYKLYSLLDLKKVNTHTRWKKLVKTEKGEFRLQTGKKTKPLKSNYFSYAKRASLIINEPAIEKQIRNHKKIFNQAITKHLKKNHL